VCERVGNHQSCGVVIARLRSSVQSHLHQHRDLHQSIYLYLSEDQEPTRHQLVSRITGSPFGGESQVGHVALYRIR
jgi:hypothetical protein